MRILLIIVLLFISCNKNNPTEPDVINEGDMFVNQAINNTVIKYKKIINYDASDIITSYLVYEYSNNIVIYKGYNALSNMTYAIRNEYDNQGRIIKAISYNVTMTKISSTIYEYE